MAQIKIKTEKHRDLTFIVLSGKVTGESIIKALKSFYSSEITTKVLWDFSNCNVSALQTCDLSNFIETAKIYGHQRTDGKSALVGRDDLAFGLGRMIISMTELDGYPIQAKIFRTVEEAIAWLES